MKVLTVQKVFVMFITITGGMRYHTVGYSAILKN